MIGRRVEAVLFDLDNTLVDVNRGWRAAFASVLATAYARQPALRDLGPGERVHDTLFQRFVSEEQAVDQEWSPEFLHRGFQRLLSHCGVADDALARELYDGYIAARPNEGLVPFPDALPTLQALSSRYRLGLVSNGRGKEQRSRIGPLGLGDCFDSIAISGELAVRKPDPAIFAHVLNALGVPAEAAIHVGDNLQADIAGAQTAGLAAVWVNRSGGGAAPYEPEAEISELAELLSLLA